MSDSARIACNTEARISDVVAPFDALYLAAHKHWNQRGPDQQRTAVGGPPYINHPIAVARVLASEGRMTCRPLSERYRPV